MKDFVIINGGLFSTQNIEAVSKEQQLIMRIAYYKSNGYTLRFDTEVERDWAFDELTKILVNNSTRLLKSN